MPQVLNKAELITEMLPYMQQYSGKTIVVKYGGHAMTDASLKYCFARDIVLLKHVGINPVIVHGGGPQIGQMLSKLGIASSFEQGFRITTPEIMDIVEMILSGKINKEIVSLISQNGGKAVGLSGRDGQLIVAEKLTLPGGKDLGLVGEVKSIDISVIHALKEFIPVVAPVGIGSNGDAYNINSDLAASAVSIAIKAEKLIILTDVDGIHDRNGGNISSINLSKLESLKESGVITGGMIPKILGISEAIKAGVSKVHIIDGRVKHSILLELFTDTGIGTEIIDDE